MRSETITSFFVFIAVLFIYAATSSPGLGLVDSGELTVTAYTLGVAHPTGYPLYTIVGRCLHILNVLVSPARAMVLLSVFVGAAAAGILTILAAHILHHGNLRLGGPVNAICGGALALSFALSHSAWCSVSFAEVYPLSCLLGTLILLAAYQHEPESEPRQEMLAVLAFYLWGLGYGNHLTIVWFAPIMFLLCARQFQRRNRGGDSVLWCIGAFVLGVTVNLYLPIRSALEPPYDWGDPQRLAELWRHVTAWQYRVWMFKGDIPGLMHKLGATLTKLPRELGWGLTVLAAVGVVSSLLRRKIFLITMLLTWFLGVLYNLNYDIPDIDSYFLLFQLPLFVIAAYGLALILNLLISSRTRYRDLVAVGVALIPLALNVGLANADVNQSGNRFAETYTREVLRTLPDSALVFQANWDIQSPFMYLQDVECVRPDVTMLDLNLMQRSWYLKQMKRRYPSVFQGCERELDTFQRLVRPFESGRAYDAHRLEAAYVALHNRIIELRSRHRPVYLRGMMEINHPGVGEGFPLIPGGYFLRVASEYVPEPVFGGDRLLLHRTSLSEREWLMMKDAVRSTVKQGKYALSRDDSSTVRRASEVVTAIALDESFAIKFVADADAYLAAKRVGTRG